MKTLVVGLSNGREYHKVLTEKDAQEGYEYLVSVVGKELPTDIIDIEEASFRVGLVDYIEII